ncbi:MAG: DNA internalization-related competence protein ComEC/Rec2 [Oscillospiraceae bacterium]|nr:DNA internalization-related competence protein ComEC/Rec2 [Oscillospiraceae bacterium]
MRKLALACFSFSAACFLARYLLRDKLGLVCAAVLAFAAVVMLFIRSPYRAPAVAALLFMALGLVYSYFYGRFFISRAEMLVSDERREISALCLDYPEFRDPGWRISVAVQSENGDVRAEVYVYDTAAGELKPGDKIRITAVSSLADRLGDDETDYYFARGDFLTLRKVRSFEITEVAPKTPLRFFHREIAHKIAESIKSAYPEDVAGLALGLITGDKTLLRGDKSLNYDMQRSGIYHIATVSGLHVSLLCGLIFALFGRRRWASIITIPLLAAFAAISGFRPSVVRAVIMQSFLLIAPLLRREDDKITNLAFALAFLLALNPLSALDVGLQLSFAATLGIILFSERVSTSAIAALHIKEIKKPRLRGLLTGIVGTVSVTLSALCFTVPLSAVHFGYFSLVSPITNVLIGWAVAPAFVLSAAAAMAAVVVPLVGTIIAHIAALFLRYIALIARLCSAIPLASIYIDNPSIVLWLAFSYLALLVLIARKTPLSQFFYPSIAIAAGLIAVIVGTNLYYTLRPGYSVTALDVGQGTALVITSGGRTAVIDCGGTYSDSAGDKTARYIRSVGGEVVDMLCVTHFHTDHINGIPALAAQMRVKSAILPDCTEENENDTLVYDLLKKADIFTCTEDMSFTLGNAVITAFAPAGAGRLNETGLSFLITCGEFDTLVTGDMSALTEVALLEKHEIPDIECLIVGHHGSAGSTSERFLVETAPEIGIISCGAFNSYGHPSPETVTRLAEFGVSYYVTADEGNITVYSEESYG